MNKKGFTLVELLAVIAILGVLVIMVVPNVLKLVNNGKKTAFLVEAKKIYRSASDNYLTSLGKKQSNVIYSEDNTALNLNNSDIKYCVKLDKNGKIKNIRVTKGKYYIYGTGDFLDAEVKEVKEGNFDDFDCNYIYTEYDENSCVKSTFAKDTIIDKMISDNCVTADNKKSEFVTGTSGIKLNSGASNTNGKGLYFTSDLTRTENNERVYYYRGDISNNNIIFGKYLTDYDLYVGKRGENYLNEIKTYDTLKECNSGTYKYDCGLKRYANANSNMCWKIVRTTEDGNVKLLYNGSTDENGNCPEKGVVQSIGSGSYGSSSDNAHVGYMYGSFTKNSTSYDEAHQNINDSTIKKKIDKWYENYILPQGETITSKIANTIYCNDRSIGSPKVLEDVEYTSDAYGKNTSVYGVTDRLYGCTGSWGFGGTPQYFCPNKNDQFTLSVENGGTKDFGNNALKYPIALLTADEIVYAGIAATSKTEYFIYSGVYWTMTPLGYYGVYTSTMLIPGTGRQSRKATFNIYYIVPSISIKGDLLVGSGDGTPSNPYVLK